MTTPKISETEHFRQVSFPGEALTLSWHDEVLVDWANGNAVYRLDGTTRPRCYTPYGPDINLVASSRGSRFVACVQRLGTKGVLIKNGRMIRELNRSLYHADAYQYPVCFLDLPDGRTALVHCPDSYDTLEIEDAETGERLSNARRTARDFFHSCLAASPNSKRVLDAGWVWHPWSVVGWFDVERALKDPSTLDNLEGLKTAEHVGELEECTAAWLDDQHIVISGPAAAEHACAPGICAHHVSIFDVETEQCVASARLKQPAGLLLPLSSTHVVTFYGHPRLVDLRTGQVVHAWLDVFSGHQESSICGWHDEPLPRLAIDPVRKRFAVAHGGTITAVSFRNT